MNETFLNQLFLAHQKCPQCPTPVQVSTFFDKVLGVLFPDLSSKVYETQQELDFHVINLKEELYEMLYMYPNRETINIENKADIFFKQLPEIYEMLRKDVKAMYDGDPAAASENEIIRSYPGFYAIAAARIAHSLYLQEVKILPRMITEHAHGRTGVDIHPGATLGEGFCIDHGTGVVIGETAHIGNFVKIYQGVTLGALSVDKSLASTKRHPTIGDHVVIYSGATVLGGKTVIGEHSIIGGNTWVTKSVEPHSKVYYQAPKEKVEA